MHTILFEIDEEKHCMSFDCDVDMAINVLWDLYGELLDDTPLIVI